MNMTVEQQVRAFIAENFYVEVSRLGDETSLISEGIIESTGVLELIQFLESEYGIRIKDTEMVPDNLETIARIGAFVARKCSAPSGGGT